MVKNFDISFELFPVSVGVWSCTLLQICIGDCFRFPFVSKSFAFCRRRSNRIMDWWWKALLALFVLRFLAVWRRGPQGRRVRRVADLFGVATTLPDRSYTAVAEVLSFNAQLPPPPQPQDSVLVLIICGNPGQPLFYESFMTHLHAALGGRATVQCVAHAGHTGRFKWHTYLDLERQVAHKVAFVRDLLRNRPPTTRLVLVGHSVGAYICLHLLREFAPRVLRCFQLFPTVANIGRCACWLFKCL